METRERKREREIKTVRERERDRGGKKGENGTVRVCVCEILILNAFQMCVQDKVFMPGRDPDASWEKDEPILMPHHVPVEEQRPTPAQPSPQLQQPPRQPPPPEIIKGYH